MGLESILLVVFVVILALVLIGVLMNRIPIDRAAVLMIVLFAIVIIAWFLGVRV